MRVAGTDQKVIRNGQQLDPIEKGLMMYKRQPSALSHGVHERRGNVSANTSHVGVMEMSSN